jgi:hypothetical protein
MLLEAQYSTHFYEKLAGSESDFWSKDTGIVYITKPPFSRYTSSVLPPDIIPPSLI